MSPRHVTTCSDPHRSVKEPFCKFNGGGKSLSIFKVTHIVRSKSVSLQPCIQKRERQKRRNTLSDFPQLACGVFRQEPPCSCRILLHKLQRCMYCAFCYVQLGPWKQEDSRFEEHKLWSPACPFLKGLFVGNKPVASNNDQLIRSRDVCGSSTVKYLCLFLFSYICVFL